MKARVPLSRRRFWLRVGGLSAATLAVWVAGLAFGPMGLPPERLCNALMGADPLAHQVLFEVRLPRVLAAGLLGALLSMAGTSFQGFLRNPLADPYLLGVAGGAGLGLTIALVAGLDSTFSTGVALFGALLAWLVVERLATEAGQLSVWRLLLAGAVVNAVAGAGIFWIQSLSSPEQLQGIIARLLGRIPLLSLEKLAALGAIVGFGLGLLILRSRDLNAMGLGDLDAGSIGVDVERVRREAYTIGSALTAIAVSQAGLIGFVGLVVPHALRLLCGPDHRFLFPAAALAGSAFLVVCDLVARTAIAPAELPVGVVTALVGGPFFLSLLVRRPQLG